MGARRVRPPDPRIQQDDGRPLVDQITGDSDGPFLIEAEGIVNPQGFTTKLTSPQSRRASAGSFPV